MENTTWLTLAIMAAITSALCTFSDNYITDVLFKGRTPQAQKVFLGVAYVVTAVLLLLLFPIQMISIWAMIGLIGAGAISSVSNIPYYLALSKDDSTNVTILQQLSPIFYLILGRVMLGENVTGGQLAALMVVMMAPMIIILSSRGKRRESKLKTVWLITLRSMLAALSGTLIVKFGYGVDLVTMLFFVTAGKGIADVALMIWLKPWQKRFKMVMRQNRGPKFWTTLTVNHILWLASEFTYYVALILAPTVAMTSAVTKTLHPMLVFSFGVVLSILWPNFGREKIRRRAILTHLTATTVAVVGIILMQVL